MPAMGETINPAFGTKPGANPRPVVETIETVDGKPGGVRQTPNSDVAIESQALVVAAVPPPSTRDSGTSFT